jgi:hypothetical protein
LRSLAACATALAALLAGPAAALDAELALGLQSQRLVERGADGAALVREQGVAPWARIGTARPLGARWRLRGALAASAGVADYDGRTQGGVAVASRSDAQSLAAQALLEWRADETARFALDGGVEVEHFRRRLRGVGNASGLDEWLTQPRGLLGATFGEQARGLRIGLALGGRAPLSVRFDDGLFDAARLRSGHAVGASVQAWHAIDARWRLRLGIETLALGRSREAPLLRDGVVVGSVTQPRWRRERIGLALERVFGD